MTDMYESQEWSEFPYEDYKKHLISGGAPFGKFNATIAEAIEAYSSIIDELQKALGEAADDLGKAANQFASMRESQEAGHHVAIETNPELFEEKERKARNAIWGQQQS